MYVDDFSHRPLVRKLDVVKKATTQECVRQFLFIVAGDDDDWPIHCLDQLLCLIDEKLHSIEFEQEVVWKLNISLVNFIDEQDGLLIALKRFPDFTVNDVI